MRTTSIAILVAAGMAALMVTSRPATLHAQGGTTPQAAPAPDDPIRTLVGRLDLEKYKATIKALTAFGDRRQGTDRNKAASDWIEKQLRSYGCADVARIKYEYAPAPRPAAGAAAGAPARPRAAAIPPKGNRAPSGVNNDPEKQPNATLRALDMQPTAPGSREEVYCTKVGATHPEEGYIVSAHMDGLGYSEAANDNGSGTALVMELARILSSPDVQVERTIRFVLWNNEETGLNGARAYAEQRGPLQGKEDPPGSGKYPEPRWLGVIAHDMMLFDHGMPGPDGKVPAEQRAEADVNIEFAGTSKMAAQAQELAWALKNANDRYAHRLPRRRRQPDEQHRLGGVPGPRAVNQPA